MGVSETKRNLSEWLNVRVDAEMLERLKAAADKEDRTVAAEIRRAIRCYLDGVKR